MKSKPTLSISAYYGGKSKMAHFIADRLNYDCSLFVTPFGGMCRVLLNKPRHRVECYNDYSSGLCALMTVLSDPDKAREFIHRLYTETEFNEDIFYKYKAIYDKYDKDAEEQAKEKLRQLLIGEKIVEPVVSRRLLDEILWRLYNPSYGATSLHADSSDDEHKSTKAVKTAFKKLLKKTQKNNAEFQERFVNLLADWIALHEQKIEDGYLPRPVDMMEDVPVTHEMDLAIATYVTFKMSRDAMGQSFGKEKFKTTDQYHAHVLKLYECAERLEGVNIFQIDAMDFFRHWRPANLSLGGDDSLTDTSYYETNQLYEWLNNPDVMMYCDPSYISVESERKLLAGIDTDNVDCFSDAIREKYKGKRWPKNLGQVYSCSFGYEDQERFLQCIQNAKCNIMVSNYDLEPVFTSGKNYGKISP